MGKIEDYLPPLKKILYPLMGKKGVEMPKIEESGDVYLFPNLLRSKTKPAPVSHIKPEDVALLQYTGGTTGVPKGAVLTHRNIVANLVQHHVFLAPNLQDGKDIAITAIPLFHILALTVSFLLAFKIGAKNVLIANPRDIPALIKEFAEHRVSCFVGVNRLFAALVDDAAFRRVDFSELRIAASGGSLLQSDVATNWKAITGKTLMDGYGLNNSP